MKNYRYSIVIFMDSPKAVKTLNDNILAGKRKGFTDFELVVKNEKTYSNVCAPVAGVLDYYREQNYEFNVIYENKESYVELTHFESPLIVESILLQGAIISPFNKVWKFTSPDGINALVSAFVLAIRQADIIEEGVISSLEWCLNETMDNVLQHSEIGVGYVMAQLHKNFKRFSVCVFDAGIGIYNSFKPSKYNPRFPLDAITLAMMEKVTRDEKVGQGNGLWGLTNIINEAKGSLYISSGGAVYSKNNLETKTIETGHFNLGKKYGTTLIDFQLDYSNKINVAKALGGYMPTDLWLENLENDNGEIEIHVAEQSGGTGTRKSAEKLRNMVLNVLFQDRKKVILNFSGINLISSSFADELIGKIINQYGFVFFIANFKIQNLTPINIAVLNRSVQQRMAQMYYDDQIEFDEEGTENK